MRLQMRAADGKPERGGKIGEIKPALKHRVGKLAGHIDAAARAAGEALAEAAQLRQIERGLQRIARRAKRTLGIDAVAPEHQPEIGRGKPVFLKPQAALPLQRFIVEATVGQFVVERHRRARLQMAFRFQAARKRPGRNCNEFSRIHAPEFTAQPEIELVLQAEFAGRRQLARTALQFCRANLQATLMLRIDPAEISLQPHAARRVGKISADVRREPRPGQRQFAVERSRGLATQQAGQIELGDREFQAELALRYRSLPGDPAGTDHSVERGKTQHFVRISEFGLQL